MSFWKTILEVGSLILPHISAMFQDIIKHFNGHYKESDLMSCKEYVRQTEHLIYCLDSLPGIDKEICKAISTDLENGRLGAGYRKFIEVIKKYQAGYYTNYLIHCMSYIMSESFDEQIIDQWSNDMTIIKGIFPIALENAKFKYRSIADKICNLELDQLDKMRYLEFNKSLDILESYNIANYNLKISPSGFIAWWIYRKDIVYNNCCDSLLFRLYNKRTEIKSENGETVILLSPARNTYSILDLDEMFFIDKDKDMITMLLTMRAKHAWVTLDPNLTKEVIIHSLLGNYVDPFRKTLFEINKLCKKFIAKYKEIEDITLSDSSVDYLISSEKFLGNGIVAYNEKLRRLLLVCAVYNSTLWYNNGFAHI